jgi:hypothetical protein
MKSWVKYLLVGLLGALITLSAAIYPFHYQQIDKLRRENQELEAIIQTQVGYIETLEYIPPSPQGTNHINLVFNAEILGVGDTGSMEPTLNGESRIIVANDPVEVGDIVVFQNGAKTWVHRIVADLGDKWVTQGDANPNQKEFVPKENVVWRVIGILY